MLSLHPTSRTQESDESAFPFGDCQTVPTILFQVVAPHFVAGFISRDGVCIKAAPIIKYLKGKSLEEIFDWRHLKGYAINQVDYYYD